MPPVSITSNLRQKQKLVPRIKQCQSPLARNVPCAFAQTYIRREAREEQLPNYLLRDYSLEKPTTDLLQPIVPP
jgi:hypothetical protein